MNTLKIKTLVLAAALGVTTSTFAGLVNINKANSEALAYHLKGVGSKKAEAIVEYRSEHGAFVDIESLVNVKGIGESTLKKNLADISLTKGAVVLLKDEAAPKKSGTKLKKPVVISKDKASKGTNVSVPEKKKTVAKVTIKESSSVTKKAATAKEVEKMEK